MRRLLPVLPLLALLAPIALPRVVFAQAPPAEKERSESEKPKQRGEKDKKKVYTNEDLESGREGPSAVQDATARGGEPYRPPSVETSPGDEPAEPAAPPDPAQPTAQEMRIKEAEDNLKALEQSANALLWQFLQSGDTNEILRLRSEQQELLQQIEQQKAELARLKGEGGTAPAPRATPPPE